MSDETSTTIDAYNAQADYYAARLGGEALDAELDRFAALLSPQAWVIDVGAGPGHYTRALINRNLKAVALDLSSGLLRVGCKAGVPRSVLADMVRLPFRAGAVDGVWVCASLLHLPVPVMPLALAELRRIVRVGGAAFISVKQGDGTAWVTTSGGGRRFFVYYQPDQLDALLTQANWRIEAGTLSADAARPGVFWITRYCRAV